MWREKITGIDKTIIWRQITCKQELVVSFYEHGNEPYDSIKYWKLHDQVSNY
jgi:hypothetical protein